MVSVCRVVVGGTARYAGSEILLPVAAYYNHENLSLRELFSRAGRQCASNRAKMPQGNATAKVS
jgi:hypothetical protein